MEDWQQRVVDEKKELDEKIKKLNSFFSTEAFSLLATTDAVLLRTQYVVMQEYSSILAKRIARF